MTGGLEEITRIRRLMATDFAAAERAADRLVAEHPHDTGALLLRAYLFNFRKDLPEAIELLNQAQHLAPGDAQIAFNRAYLSQQTGAFGKAHELFAALAGEDGNQADVGLLAALNRLWAGGAPRDRLALAAGTRLSPGGALVARAISARLGETVLAAGPPPDTTLATGVVNFLNRYDVPGWGILDDKAELWRLAAADAPGLIPETFTEESEREALHRRPMPRIPACGWASMPACSAASRSSSVPIHQPSPSGMAISCSAMSMTRCSSAGTSSICAPICWWARCAL